MEKSISLTIRPDMMSRHLLPNRVDSLRKVMEILELWRKIELRCLQEGGLQTQILPHPPNHLFHTSQSMMLRPLSHPLKQAGHNILCLGGMHLQSQVSQPPSSSLRSINSWCQPCGDALS